MLKSLISFYLYNLFYNNDVIKINQEIKNSFNKIDLIELMLNNKMFKIFLKFFFYIILKIFF